MWRFFVFTFILLMHAFDQYGQTTPIGYWSTHFSSTGATTVERIGNKIYLGGLAIRIYDAENQEFSGLSKVNGLSDVNVQHIRHDVNSGYTLIAYLNSNIDLLYEGVLYNIPDLKNYSITGSKSINSVYFFNQLMYLSTDFGIVVLNPLRREIKETYALQQDAKVLAIRDLCVSGSKFYAATSQGIYSASINDPALQNFANWTRIENRASKFILNGTNQLIYITDSDSMFSLQNGISAFLYHAESPILRVREGNAGFYLCESDNNIREIGYYTNDGIKVDSMNSNINPRDVVEIAQGLLYSADHWEGLTRISQLKNKELVRTNEIYDNTTYNLSIGKNALYVSGGAENGWQIAYNSAGFFKYAQGEWTTYNRSVGTSGLDSILDIVDIAVDPSNGYLYAASFGGGLYEYHPDGSHVIYRNTPWIQSQIGNPGAYLIAGLALDAKNNLWMSNYSAPDQLVVKKKDGSWQKFSFPYNVSERSASQVLIDNANHKWLLAPRGIGIYVLDDNGSIDNPDDDQIRKLQKGAGYGNLPSNEVYCMEKDQDGKIWVGTNDGIAIYNCAESMFSSTGCDAELKIVKYDLNAGLLFQRELVKTIAVDGANNKWIGTNNGVWLISDDAEKILQRFTKDNSPLPTNEIRRIKVHPQTGEVFIATTLGLVSWRGDATEGAANNDNLLVFPNPVPADFTGTIAISGLVENADVRITDVSGQLVFRTKAQGGQAVWNGRNYTGQKPRTGVYYVFVTNADGTETKTGKFVFNE